VGILWSGALPKASGSATDDLWVRVNDGTEWSNWKEFHVSDWHI
jgi:hypothetical protein